MSKPMSDAYGNHSIVALGGATAAAFVAESRSRGFCTAWAFQRTVDDFELIARRIWRPRAQSMMDMLNGYSREQIVLSPYSRQGDCRDRLKSDMWESLRRPTVHVAVFLDEMPKPMDPNGMNLTFFPDDPKEMRNYRRRMKKAIEFLGKRGKVAAVSQEQENPQLRNESVCLDNTKRYWRPVLKTYLCLYGADGRLLSESMSGLAKIIFMLVTS